MLTISCNLLDTVLKVKTSMVVWVQDVVTVPVICCCDCLADWELRLAAAAQHHRREPYRISQAWKESKFKVWFLLNVYQLCTVVKSKNHKSNHRKSGTIYTSSLLHPPPLAFGCHQASLLSPLGVAFGALPSLDLTRVYCRPLLIPPLTPP